MIVLIQKLDDNMNKKYRLITRSDMDGLVCGTLLTYLDIIDEIIFVHPKDMQDGIIETTENDIVTNLPYVEKAHLIFDHHLSETVRNNEIRKNHIINPTAPSAARVVFDYYGGKEVFKNIPEEMMVAVDKADSAQFNMEDVLQPKGWELLSFLMDARTGLGRFREFRVSNYQLMMDLIAYCKTHTIEEILDLPDVKERVELYFRYEKDFKMQLEKCTKVYGNVVVVDLRKEEIIYPGNRFMVYAMYPETNISIHVIWGVKQQNTVFAVGKSIFDKTSKINIGDVMLKRGGGGHMAAGTCQMPNETSNTELIKLIDELKD